MQGTTRVEALVARRDELRRSLAEVEAELAAASSEARASAPPVGEWPATGEAQLRSILDESEVGVFSMSANGERLVYANPALARILGVPATALETRPTSLIPFMHPDDQALGRAARASRLQGEPGRLDCRILRPDGETRWVRFVARPIRDGAGAVVRIDTLAVEFTEQRRAEEALQRSNAELSRRVEEATIELSRTNASLERDALAKDAFFAGMSHELRTPLNSVLGVAEALEEEVYGPLDPRQRAALGRISESGRHLLALLGDILDLAKMEAGKATLDLETVTLSEVCRQSLALVEGAAHCQRTSVALQVSNGYVAFLADERRLKQILVNLLGNAIKFTPAGGAVGLDAIADLAADEVRFRVWDRGPGIAPAAQGRLFQPFVQVDPRAHIGSGLGLSLARGLVELHGGLITVESTLGEGTAFMVALPLRGAQGGAA